MDGQAIATDQANLILEMLGPHGIYAIIATIFIIRTIRAKVYLEATASIAVMVVASAIIGSGVSYFALVDPTQKMILGGGFMTIIGVPAFYELIKWAIALAYRQLGWRILIVMYFFISPKPLKKPDENGELVEVEQPETLTRYMDWRAEKE